MSRSHLKNHIYGLTHRLVTDWFTMAMMCIVLLLAFEFLYFAQTASSTFEITILYTIAFAMIINSKSIYKILKSEQ
jgi:hypothetical protein